MSAGELISKGDIVPEVQPDNLLEVIARAVSNPALDVEKLSKLLDVHERIVDAKRRQAFAEAIARLQAKLPQIQKDGRIVVQGTERSRYAKLETIDAAIKPLLETEGFSFSFNEEAVDGNNRRYSARLLHREGHSEVKFITLPLDVSGSKSGVQSAGSTAAYAMRYLIKMHLALVERGEDLDGENLQCITEEQAKDLEALAVEVKADMKKFLDYMGVVGFDFILVRDYPKALAALEQKRRSIQK